MYGGSLYSSFLLWYMFDYFYKFKKIKNRKNICQAPGPVPGKGRLPPLRMATLYILVGWWGITHTSSATTGIVWDHARQIKHLKLVFSALQLKKVKQIAWLRWGYMSLPSTLPGKSAWVLQKPHSLSCSHSQATGKSARTKAESCKHLVKQAGTTQDQISLLQGKHLPW